MILDALAQLSTAQAVTSTAISDVYDLGVAGRDIGLESKQLYLVIQVPTAATASGSATVTFTLESDSTANLATAPVVHWTSSAIGKATLVVGYMLIVPIPTDLTYKRYLGARYTVATGPLTAGAFNAFITPDIQRWQSKADALPAP